MSQSVDHDPLIDELWRIYLTTGEIPGFAQKFGYKFKDMRRFLKRLPTEPRCPNCYAPFEGLGGRLVHLVLGKERSKLNPNYCNACEDFARKNQGGAEIELTLLFADVRGSTTLAEGMSPSEFRNVINRFYMSATRVMISANALIEKLIGDEVTGLFVPGMAGPQHARVAIETARSILNVTGHADPGGPWVPVGVGVHSGRAFVGAVGTEGGVTDITALGDDVNVAARLASLAGPGEIVVSQATCAAAGQSVCAGEARHLALKGRAEPVDVRVERVGSAEPTA